MFNLYSKKAPTEYNTQNVVQVIDAEIKNQEGKCNFCDGKIYWNPSVIHRRTRKKMPLSEPYYGHGTKPVAHRGCVYNLGNFYKNLVLQESDTPYVRATKINQQKKLFGVDESGLTLVERLIRDRLPEEVDRCNEFLKKSTESKFTPGK
jgi:hypothetical protein